MSAAPPPGREPRPDTNQAKRNPGTRPRLQRHTDAPRSIARAATNKRREMHPKPARKKIVLRSMRKRTERVFANDLAQGSLGVAASLGLALAWRRVNAHRLGITVRQSKKRLVVCCQFLTLQC